MKYNDYIILIPSRLGSTRLKEKPLIKIEGKPLILHVLDTARKANLDIPILVATDSNIIAQIVNNAGGKAILTDCKHQSGSDRINEAVNIYDPQKKFKKIIHLQGDLPNISSELIKQLANLISKKEILATPIVKATYDEINNPNIVKCAASFEKEIPQIGDVGKALYFSRSEIPWGKQIKWHHLGIYGWDRNILEKFVSLKPSPLEKSEKLEQLRALEAGFNIRVLITKDKPIGIDTKEDLKKFQNLLQRE